MNVPNKLLIIIILLVSSSFNCQKNKFDKYGFERKYATWMNRGVKFGYTGNPKIKFFSSDQSVILHDYRKSEIIEDFNFYLKTIKDFNVVDSIQLDSENNGLGNININFHYSSVYSDGQGKFYSFFKIDGLNAVFFGYLIKSKDGKTKVEYIQLAD